MSFKLIKNKQLNEIRRHYLRYHESLAFDSVDVIENTTQYNIDLLSKFFEMLPVKGDSTEGWLTIQGPHFVTSNDIKTSNTVKPNIPLFDVQQGEYINMRLNFKIGTPKEHSKFRHAYKFEQIGDDVKVYFNI